MLPLTSTKWRDDANEPRAVIFRVVSISLLVYMGYLFFQDEKNLEDLKEFTVKGVSDLLDYNKEWEVGTFAIGGAKNATSFKEKFTSQMKEDITESEEVSEDL